MPKEEAAFTDFRKMMPLTKVEKLRKETSFEVQYLYTRRFSDVL